MEEKIHDRNPLLKKTLICLLLILAAVISFFPLANRVASPDTYRETIAALDAKSETVLKLSASSALVSAAITAIPDDICTPIAEKMADFTEYFLLILCVLYAEKYLLTVMGVAAFRILIPGLCIALIAGLFWNRGGMRRAAWKMGVLAVALLLVVPVSLRVSDKIYDTYSISINETLEESEDFSSQASALSEADGDKGLIASILERLSESFTSLGARASRILNRYVESLAVLIVTSCIIPILILLFFLWLVKVLFGISVPVSLPRMGRR